MVLGWAGRQREERSVGELIARKQHSRALELLRAQLELGLATREPGGIVFSEGERGRILFVLSGGTVEGLVRDATGRNLSLREMERRGCGDAGG